MTVAHDFTDHHAAAAVHHEQAAYFHREASRHYQIGKDYAHAAHQALTAKGHALRALEHGQDASTIYSEHAGSPLPGYLAKSSGKSGSTAVTSPRSLTETSHHAVAADHHEAARRHHVRAGDHESAEHYVRANHETNAALGHCKHALFHSDQAAMHHMESYGNHATIELV